MLPISVYRPASTINAGNDGAGVDIRVDTGGEEEGFEGISWGRLAHLQGLRVFCLLFQKWQDLRAYLLIVLQKPSPHFRIACVPVGMHPVFGGPAEQVNQMLKVRFQFGE